MITNISELQYFTEMYGDGFYIISEKRIKNIYSKFEHDFSTEYPNCGIAYSFKTCFEKGLLTQLLKLGAMAEVTSEYEYFLAKKVGFGDEKIVYNGPYKKMNIILEIAQNGGIVNIDSLKEAEQFCEVYNEDKPVAVGIRCNFNVDGRKSRFGVDILSMDMDEIIKKLTGKNIEVAGFMCHIKTKTFEDWGKKVQVMVDFVANAIDKYKLKNVRYVDFGGGYQFVPELFKEYANIISTQMKRLNNHNITMILEPGAAIAEGVMDYYAKVVNINIAQGIKNVTVAATISDLSAIRKKVPGPVRYVKKENSLGFVKQEYLIENIVGFTCLENDVILTDICENLELGDYVVFLNVGAYASALRSNFIRGLPAVLLESVEGNITVDRFATSVNC